MSNNSFLGGLSFCSDILGSYPGMGHVSTCESRQPFPSPATSTVSPTCSTSILTPSQANIDLQSFLDDLDVAASMTPNSVASSGSSSSSHFSPSTGEGSPLLTPNDFDPSINSWNFGSSCLYAQPPVRSSPSETFSSSLSSTEPLCHFGSYLPPTTTTNQARTFPPDQSQSVLDQISAEMRQLRGAKQIGNGSGKDAPPPLSRAEVYLTPSLCPLHPRLRRTRLKATYLLKTGKRKFRCDLCTRTLEEYAEQHGLRPSADEKRALQKTVGMTLKQINNWFENKRRIQLSPDEGADGKAASSSSSAGSPQASAGDELSLSFSSYPAVATDRAEVTRSCMADFQFGGQQSISAMAMPYSAQQQWMQ